MAQTHVQRMAHGRGRIDAVRGLSQALLGAVPADDAQWAALRLRITQLETYPDQTIAHDVLSDNNAHFWLREVAARLDGVGLQFVVDAKPVPAIELRAYPKLLALMALGGDDPLLRAQYLDMARLVRFSQIVVARKGTAPAAAPLPERMKAVRLRGTITAKSREISLARGVAATFTTSRGLDFTLDDPLAKAAVFAIASALPHGLAFNELPAACARVLRQAGLEREVGRDPEAHLARVLADLVGFELLLPYLERPPLPLPPASGRVPARSLAGSSRAPNPRSTPGSRPSRWCRRSAAWCR